MTKDILTEYLFSYGTLQLEAVQMATYCRCLTGRSDALKGFKLVPLAIEDEVVKAISGKAVHTMAIHSGRDADVISGTVFELTPLEIQKTDEYEVSAVKRITVVLESGQRAWVYVDARYLPSK